MCFYARKCGISAKVAKKNIRAYKLFSEVTGDIASPFQPGCIWNKGVVKTVSLVSSLPIFTDTIDEGLHAFKSRKAAEKFMHKESWHTIRCVIIPKGSLYYENFTQYVSSKMVVPSFGRPKKIEIPKKKK